MKFLKEVTLLSLSLYANSAWSSTVYINPSSITGQDGETITASASTFGFPGHFPDFDWSLYPSYNNGYLGGGNFARIKLDYRMSNRARLSVTARSYNYDTLEYESDSDSVSIRVRPNDSQVIKRMAFVNRLYTQLLGRQPGAAELASYREGVSDYDDETCAGLASGFVFSGEFVVRAKSLDAATFVTRMYRSLLGRAPEEPSFSAVVGQLRRGSRTRQSYAEGFLKTKEFGDLCSSKYGYREPGNVHVQNRLTDPYIPELQADRRVSYLKKLYVYVLGRQADAVGLDYWTKRLTSASSPTCAGTAVSFLMSPEFQARNRTMSVRAYATSLYRILLGRSPDAGGLAYWTQPQFTRQYMTNHFLKSDEFNELCRTKYGFTAGAGSYSGLSMPTPK